jgi:hypothetical protein
MSMQSAFGSAQARSSNAQLEALKVQFGSVVASRILEAEAADFHWRARVKERYVGQHLDDDFGCGEELSRMAIVSDLNGHWHAGVCLVDGDGEVETLLWLRTFSSQDEALATFDRAH